MVNLSLALMNAEYGPFNSPKGARSIEVKEEDIIDYCAQNKIPYQSISSRREEAHSLKD